MVIDKLMSPAINTLLSTLTVSTQTLGTVMDLGVGRNNGLIASATGPGWVVTVKGGTSGGAATLNFSIVTDDNAALSSATTLWTGTALALAATAGAGSQFFIPVPNTLAWERYAAFRATVGTAVFTGGTVSVGYVANSRAWNDYPSKTGR